MIKGEIWGPEEIVNNTNFLLDIDYRDNKAAYKYAMLVKEKYSSLLENNKANPCGTGYISCNDWLKKYL